MHDKHVLQERCDANIHHDSIEYVIRKKFKWKTNLGLYMILTIVMWTVICIFVNIFNAYQQATAIHIMSQLTHVENKFRN